MVRLILRAIKSVADQVINGKIRLPHSNLDTNSEYDCCWALVDYGAGVNCATRKQFPNATPCGAPSITLTSADGKNLEDDGKETEDNKEGWARQGQAGWTRSR